MKLAFIVHTLKIETERSLYKCLKLCSISFEVFVGKI